MFSSACKFEDHGLCHVKGRIKQASGKIIRCECVCHGGRSETRRERKWRKRKEQAEKESVE